MERKKKYYRVTRQGVITFIAGTCIATACGFGTGYMLTPHKTEVITKEKVKVQKHYITLLDVSGMDKYYNVPLSHNLQDYIQHLCDDKDVPMSLVIALIDQESGFNQEATSNTDDYGLMQINSVNFNLASSTYHCVDIMNPYQNVYVGISLIAELMHKYDNDMNKALMAYNMGESAMLNAYEKGITSSDYSNSIISKKEMYERSLNEQ